MPDVNVLVYAHRAEQRTHAAYREWLERLVNGPEPFALSVLVAVAFVRIVTNARVFSPPTPPGVALAVVEQLVQHPRCHVVVPREDHWSRVSGLCRSTSASGKLVADAQHAGVAMSAGCTWVTRDADFSRFAAEGLRWQHLVLDAPRGK
jgi:toxin-antitoxin system PIN domain toxin